ncbi:MAG TPA: metal-dependent hydrolase [Oligoflexia bacterium]|nr:metal-dependent hydrolase [Oligoflexia bacterium]HMR24239.1 metal-dependent hydrolase [Oligoflexia bacterium]
MDPISQGVVGASFSQSTAKQKVDIKMATVLGFLSGMAPDLDILIRSAQDPLLGLEYHRQFTHSLAFIPIGGLLCALIAKIFIKNKLSFLQVYIFCTVGWATHGLLDACTTYGTLLFWPFSYQRVAWNNVSIIDPLFTLPLLILMVMTLIKKKKQYAQWACAYIIVYLGFGLLQAQRARYFLQSKIADRQHHAEKIMVSPSFANLLLWRTVYEYEGYYYVDAVRVGVTQQIFQGDKIKKFEKYQDLPWLVKGSTQDRDIERFRWFTNDYLSWSDKNPYTIQDVRYAMSPRATQSLWGLELSPNAQDKHALFERVSRDSSKDREEFWEMLFYKATNQ